MLQRLPTYRRLPALIVGCVLLAATAYVVPAFGQFSEVWSAKELQIGQNTNLFAHWDGRSSLNGVFVELPTGWTLEEAVALRQGYARVELEVQRMDRGVYVVSAPHGLRGVHEFVLRVQTGGLPGQATWSIIPFLRRSDRGHVRLIPREGFRITRPVLQITPTPALDNRVLAFRGDGPPWLLRRAALPDLGTRAAYTVEFWMRTTDLNEVVLSTWNGEERTAYPLEIIVDASGRLRYYRGQPEQHTSMATPAPVADGQWHHVALTHEPRAGWTRLFLDGVAADSLYSPTPPAIMQRSALALGARLPSPETSAETIGGYTGLLDELRLWPRARRLAEIRHTMRQPLEAADDQVVLLGFEEAIPNSLVERRASRTERVFSDLAFYYPVRNVQAVVEAETVLLTWETKDPHTTAFVVERSTDGRSFESIGEVTVPEAGPRARSEQARPFEFRDADVAAQVVFYRIRQRFKNGTERLSGAIKMGLGRDKEEDAFLVGNFPNPFNPTTTIVYKVRKAQHVRISVWDLSGQQVTVLVDEVHQPGNFEVGFEGNDLPSGTYFGQLQSSNGPMQTHQMILMK
ncbi:MAG: T9SS type A sorting domain-containing protein [Bacteroidetes bacterium]|nr:T9SS type A sorting domain-containing protein [Bacteroidota bacterium]